MLVELHTKDKVVGIKQLKKALAEGRAKKVFVAGDADPKLTDPAPITLIPTGICLG